MDPAREKRGTGIIRVEREREREREGKSDDRRTSV